MRELGESLRKEAFKEKNRLKKRSKKRRDLSLLAGNLLDRITKTSCPRRGESLSGQRQKLLSGKK
jgi:hypothetical protein